MRRFTIKGDKAVIDDLGAIISIEASAEGVRLAATLTGDGILRLTKEEARQLGEFLIAQARR